MSVCLYTLDFMYICVYVCVSVCVSVCLFVCLCVCLSVFVSLCVCVCVSSKSLQCADQWHIVTLFFSVEKWCDLCSPRWQKIPMLHVFQDINCIITWSLKRTKTTDLTRETAFMLLLKKKKRLLSHMGIFRWDDIWLISPGKGTATERNYQDYYLISNVNFCLFLFFFFFFNPRTGVFCVCVCACVCVDMGSSACSRASVSRHARNIMLKISMTTGGRGRSVELMTPLELVSSPLLQCVIWNLLWKMRATPLICSLSQKNK